MIARSWAVIQWAFAAVLFTVAPMWALYRFNVTGDGRWFLTIIGAPLMGVMTTVLGSMFWQIANEERDRRGGR